MKRLNICSSCFGALLLFLTGCATYQTKVEESRKLIQGGQPSAAAEKLKPLAEVEGDDQLIYLLDYGVAEQLAGNFQESNKAFLRADRLSEVKDYHSISRIGGSLLLNEGMVQYKGEDFEKVMINAYLAINYIMLGLMDDALVEARRLNEKLYKYKFEAKMDYEQNPFARYLSAMVWEAERKWDDAYIEYQKVFELQPTFPLIGKDLLRSAILAQRPEEIAKWKKRFPQEVVQPEWTSREFGELVLVYQQGWGPRKRPHPGGHRLPKLFPVHSRTSRAKVEVYQNNSMVSQSVTDLIYDLEGVATKTFNDAIGALIAKRVAGIATKAVVADQIRQKDENLGMLAWVVMNLADQADLRQWSTLPESFQVARLRLKPGTYRVNIRGLDRSKFPSGEEKTFEEVAIRGGKMAFVHWRSFN